MSEENFAILDKMECRMPASTWSYTVDMYSHKDAVESLSKMFSFHLRKTMYEFFNGYRERITVLQKLYTLWL